MNARCRAVLALSLMVALLVPTTGPAWAGGERQSVTGSGGNAVVNWNVTATSAAVACGLTPNGNPLAESRLYAMVHIAIHDALNAIAPRFRSYTGQPAPTRDSRSASPEAAVAAAAFGVLSPALPCASAQLQNAYDQALAALPDGPAEAAGIHAGRAAAEAIQTDRSTDGSAELPLIVTDFPQGSQPGQYRFTPGQTFAFQPGWGTVRPFALSSAGQFTPSGPYAVTSPAYARDLNEVKSLGGDDATGSRRTPDQTEIALYWVNSSPLQWNSIARTVLAGHGKRMDMWDTARLFGLLNMALADGYIASFYTKYLDPDTRLFWRPVTAIQEADTDGNRATSADPDWAPLRGTPPIPDYESAHAVEGGSAASVLTAFFGDRVRFAACSVSYPESANACAGTGGTAGVVRSFGSLSQAAAENAVSRIYVGFHFRKAAQDGNRHGYRIGNWTVSTVLRPVR